MSADRNPVSVDVLAANEAFYAAFTHGDVLRMGRLWASHATVTCLHPGMQVLHGRDAVMRSWQAILRVRPELPLRCLAPRVQLVGSVALVTCYEAAGDGPGHLAATNVFLQESGEWKMVLHQAGPLQHPVAPEQSATGLN
jgi:ketosteroid isomerase-like protein